MSAKCGTTGSLREATNHSRNNNRGAVKAPRQVRSPSRFFQKYNFFRHFVDMWADSNRVSSHVAAEIRAVEYASIVVCILALTGFWIRIFWYPLFVLMKWL